MFATICGEDSDIITCERNPVMIEKAKEFYSLFWNYDLTDEEAKEMLANSTLKQRREF